MATWNAIDLLGAQIDTVDSSQVFPLGQRCSARHITGLYVGEFVYMKGAASVAAASWCLLNHDNGTVSLLADGDLGGVGVSMGAIIASTYGWFQTAGKASGLLVASVADSAGLYTTATGGTAGATDTGQSEIIGARAAAASGSSGGATEVEIEHPHIGLSAAG